MKTQSTENVEETVALMSKVTLQAKGNTMKSKKKNGCFTCGKKDHMRKDCKGCFSCGSKYHLAKNCVKKQTEHNSRGRRHDEQPTAFIGNLQDEKCDEYAEICFTAAIPQLK